MNLDFASRVKLVTWPNEAEHIEEVVAIIRESAKHPEETHAQAVEVVKRLLMMAKIAAYHEGAKAGLDIGEKIALGAVSGKQALVVIEGGKAS